MEQPKSPAKNANVLQRKTSRQKLISDLFGFFLHRILERRACRYLQNGYRRLAIFSFDYVSNTINISGIYEKDNLEILFSYLNSLDLDVFNGTAVDIGANIGNHSLYFSDFFLSVVSYEANPKVFDILQINSRLNNNVSCYNFAISSSSGRASLNYNPTNLGGASLIDQGCHQVQDVPMEKLDSFTEKLGNVKLIKIDVEGAEFKVLSGAAALIKAAMPIILLEQSLTEIENGTSQCIELLKEYGYKKFLIIESSPAAPFKISGGLGEMLGHVFAIIFGQKKTLKECSYFEPTTYPFIIAVPEAIDRSGLSLI